MMATVYATSLRSLAARRRRATTTDLPTDHASAEEGYDCDGCLNDADGDGVCDEFEVAGCQELKLATTTRDATDETACTSLRTVTTASAFVNDATATFVMSLRCQVAPTTGVPRLCHG